MSYALSLGSLHVLGEGAAPRIREASCHGAKEQCTPSFVFSVDGQVGFRSALEHLSSCEKSSCRSLRAKVLDGMIDKLRWLMKQECLLGCVHVQPALYGARSISLKRQDFGAVAEHLARCPKDSCAQLRRALLLTVRERVKELTVAVEVSK